jgi:hypothetical protein
MFEVGPKLTRHVYFRNIFREKELVFLQQKMCISKDRSSGYLCTYDCRMTYSSFNHSTCPAKLWFRDEAPNLKTKAVIMHCLVMAITSGDTNRWVWSNGGMMTAGVNWRISEKNSLQCHFVHHKFHRKTFRTEYEVTRWSYYLNYGMVNKMRYPSLSTTPWRSVGDAAV